MKLSYTYRAEEEFNLLVDKSVYLSRKHPRINSSPLIIVWVSVCYLPTVSRMFLELFFFSCVLPSFTSHIFVIFPSCDWLPCPDQPHLFLLNCTFLVYVVVLTDVPSFQPVPLHFLGFTFYIFCHHLAYIDYFLFPPCLD